MWLLNNVYYLNCIPFFPSWYPLILWPMWSWKKFEIAVDVRFKRSYSTFVLVCWSPYFIIMHVTHWHWFPLCVYLSRFGLWPGDYICGADINRESQWSECEAGLSVHSGPWRFWTAGYWVELVVLWQPERRQSGTWRCSLQSIWKYILQ